MQSGDPLNYVRWLMEDAVNASLGITGGICSYAICDYIFQSLFLKMTGFSEQKAKCICWELATEDYEFRRDYLRSISSYGEMSDITSRNRVYNDIVGMLKKSDSSFTPAQVLDKNGMLEEVKQTMTEIFSGSLLIHSNHRHYMEFVENYDKIFKSDYFAKEESLLEGNLIKAYKALYDHRNRCAHNLLSYQQNLPTLKKLADDKYQYENYYIRFALLLLMDKIYIGLFKAMIA